MSKIIFIAGISGSGKSTLVKNLRKSVKNGAYNIYDFDEVGVPDRPDLKWRLDTTDHWLKIAKENLDKNKGMIICGQFVPSEIRKSIFFSKRLNIIWGFLHIDDSKIEERLSTYRKLKKEKIETFIKWALSIENKIKNEKKYQIFDTTNLNENEVCELVIDWVSQL